jgi:predicted dehydrogenase
MNMENARPIRLGLIGAGGISKEHIKAALGLPERAVLQAICDVNEKAAAEKAEAHGIREVYSDYKQMLASPNVDAVIITVPNFLHAQVSVDSLRAGKHVLCEKPMVMKAEEADAIIRARDESGKQFMVSMNNRFRQAAQWLHERIESGAFGDIYHAKTGWVRRRGIPAWGAWFFDRERSGGGPLIDLGVHMLDVTLWLLGHPSPVAVTGKTYAKFGPRHQGAWPGTAFAPNAAYTVEDFATAFIQLENDATVLLETSWASHIEEERAYVELLGTEGGVRWEWNVAGNRQEVKWFRNEHGIPADVTLHFDDQGERVALLDHFLTSITENTTPLCTAEQGLVIAKVLEAIYESSEQGRQVQIEW